MKLVLHSVAILLGLGSCTLDNQTSEIVALKGENNLSRQSPAMKQISGKENTPNKTRNFTIMYDDWRLEAIVNDGGNIQILNYPQQVKAKIIFRKKENMEVFSPSECQRIKESAEGLGLSVRNQRLAKLALEIPPFLSDDFLIAARKAAALAGFERKDIVLENYVDTSEGVVDLFFTDDAISKIMGYTSMFAEEVNPGMRGREISPSEIEFLIGSYDFLCDLVQGKAQIIIRYPIANEDSKKEIKYIYDVVKTVSE